MADKWAFVLNELTYGTVDDCQGGPRERQFEEDVVWCDGGGQALAALAGHIDEWTISVIPTLLGSGIPLFPKDVLRKPWKVSGP